MRFSKAILGTLTLSLLLGASMAQARYDFDNAGDSVYGQNKYQYYYQSYVQACGDYHTKDDSSLFGDQQTHLELYPQIGQVHAELEQVRAMHQGSRNLMVSKFTDAKRIMDIGYSMKDVHDGQLSSFGQNVRKTGGEEYYAHAQDRLIESHDHLNRSMRMKREDAYSDVMSAIRSDGSVDHNGIETPSSYDRWQDCKGFWSHAETHRLGR